MPWKWLYYIGRVQLGFSENEFWRMTPRKLLLIWDEHCKFKGWKKEDEKDVYIDELGWL